MRPKEDRFRKDQSVIRAGELQASKDRALYGEQKQIKHKRGKFDSDLWISGKLLFLKWIFIENIHRG